MIAILRYKNIEYDLTPYIDITDNNRIDTIEEQLDSGKLVLSRVPANAFIGLDMSKRVPSFCELYFNNEKGTERYYYTADTQCFEVIRGRRWKHEIGLIELSKELQLTPIRDMTITQPQDGNYYSASSARTMLALSSSSKETIFKNLTEPLVGGRSWLSLGTAEIPYDYGVLNSGENSGLKIENSLVEIPMDKIDETNPTIIDGNVIKEVGNFNLSYNISVLNPHFSATKNYQPNLNWWGHTTFALYPVLEVYMQINAETPILINTYTTVSKPVASATLKPLPNSGEYHWEDVQFDITASEETLTGNYPINITTADSTVKLFVKTPTTTKWRSQTRLKYWWGGEAMRFSEFNPRLYSTNATMVLYKETDAELSDPELPIRLGQTAEKIIRLSKLDLFLSESTLQRLNTYGTPENTFTKFTAWDALKEIGAVVGALPEIVINESGQKELVFQYYADMESDYVVIDPPNVQQVSNARNIDNYVSSIQLNADNIVSSNLAETSPYNKDYEANTLNAEIATDWTTLRAGSDGNVKITTDNIGLKLPYRIYQMRQVEIKGIDLNAMTGGVLPYSSSYIWKLNEDEDQLRIVEEKYYKTLEDANDYTVLSTRILPKKNNTIYYRQGDYRLYGFSFTAQYKPVWDVDPAETAGYRSIYEMLFVKAIIKAGIDQTQLNSILGVLKDTGTVTADNNIKMRVTYVPQDLSRATIYKEDISGFELPNTEKYFNETAIVNDPLSLGANAQDTVNRLGNTLHTVIGFARPQEQLPFIGSKTSDNKILTSITYNDRPFRTDYVANYVQDFSVITDYVGIKSPHRQYEIPNDGIVLALDKNKTHIFLDTQEITPSTSVWGNNVKEFFDLKATKSKAPLFAEVSTYLFASDYDSDTKDELFIRPLTKIPTGKTISFKYQMDTNFSAGATKKKTTVDGEDVYWQEEVPYTTKFGRCHGVRVRLVEDVFKGNITSDPTVEDKYTILDENVVLTTYTDNKYVVDKDAREIMALSEEVAFHSNSVNDIILYDGITKFNPMTLTDVSRNNIKIAIMNDNYKVSKSAKKVDYAGLQSVGGSILNGITYTLYDNRIEFSLPPEAQGKGLVIYNDNVDSGDLVMIYLTEINGNEIKTLYFGTKKLGE